MYDFFISILGELICCLISTVFDEIREPKVLHFCFSIKMGKEKIQYLQYIQILYRLLFPINYMKVFINFIFFHFTILKAFKLYYYNTNSLAKLRFTRMNSSDGCV